MVGARHQDSEVCISRVRFAALDEATIAAYVATGEPFGKAGAYAIQGRGGTLVAHLEGSYSGVMGLPVFETARLLTRFGE
jgi:septum formation protein